MQQKLYRRGIWLGSRLVRGSGRKPRQMFNALCTALHTRDKYRRAPGSSISRRRSMATAASELANSTVITCASISQSVPQKCEASASSNALTVRRSVGQYQRAINVPRRRLRIKYCVHRSHTRPSGYQGHKLRVARSHCFSVTLSSPVLSVAKCTCTALDTARTGCTVAGHFLPG